MDAHTEGRIIVATYPTGQRVLWLQVQFNCQACGTGGIQIPGHHLVVLKDLVDQTIRDYPELTQAAFRREREEPEEFTGTPGDPSTN